MPLRSQSRPWFYGSLLVTVLATLWAVQGAYSFSSSASATEAKAVAAPDAPIRQTVAQAMEK